MLFYEGITTKLNISIHIGPCFEGSAGYSAPEHPRNLHTYELRCRWCSGKKRCSKLMNEHLALRGSYDGFDRYDGSCLT